MGAVLVRTFTPPPGNPARPDADVRRAHERAELRLEVTVEGEYAYFPGLIENLSEGGVFVVTDCTRAVGALIAVEFQLEGRDEPIRVVGEVRWLRRRAGAKQGPVGMGLRFVDLADEDAEAIAAAIQVAPTDLPRCASGR